MTRIADPMVMYLVVPTRLDMNRGKTASAVGHAVHQLVRQFDRDDDSMSTEDWAAFDRWEHEDAPAYTKITLGADAEEWMRVKAWAASSRHHLVVDRGFSQVPEGTWTCLGLWPMRKSKAPECLSTLKPLR